MQAPRFPDMTDGIEHYLIRGETSQHGRFRPGDWAERLTGVITLFVGERCPGIHMASTWLAMPVVEQGIKCLRVAHELKHICPDAFDFVVRFARDNELVLEVCRIREERMTQAQESKSVTAVTKASSALDASMISTVTTAAPKLGAGRADWESVDGNTCTR